MSFKITLFSTDQCWGAMCDAADDPSTKREHFKFRNNLDPSLLLLQIQPSFYQVVVEEEEQ
jgi:hypothetical protein